MLNVKQKHKISLKKAGLITKLLLVVIIFAGLSSAPLTVFAATPPASPPDSTGFCTDSKGNKNKTCTDPAMSKKCSNNECDFIKLYVNPAINMLTIVFGLIAAASIIAGGIQFSTSTGDPQKSAAARHRITNTLISVMAYLFMYSFLEFLVPGGVFNR